LISIWNGSDHGDPRRLFATILAILPFTARLFRAFALCAFLQALSGHDLYLLPTSFHVKSGETLRVAMHNGDSFPDSEVAPHPERMKDALLMGDQGMSFVQYVRTAGKETIGDVVVPGEGSLLLSVRSAPNLIELAPDKFLAYLKEEGLGEVIAWRAKHGEANKPGRERYSKYAKSLLQSGHSDDFYQHELGFPLEIVPLVDPYAVHAGGSLPVRVLFRGKPAVGLQLETAWSGDRKSKTAIAGKTDDSGMIAVPIINAGKWRLHALVMERCSEPQAADWESYWASITFETP
jgi:Domain of unknown function (DUF4198)